MVKSSKSSSSAAVAVSLQKVSDQASSSSSSSPKYKGVRKRRWGKYVSEIRLPNSRERIWLGSYDAPEKAARAFDAAQFCLRGRSATFNFPDDPPEIVGAGFMTPAEIQAAAARHAHADPRAPVGSGRVDDLDTDTDSFSSNINGSPATYVSAAQVDLEVTEIPMDNSYLDHIFTLGSDENSIPDFGVFPGFDNDSGDLIIPRVDYWSENNEETLFSASLWNF